MRKLRTRGSSRRSRGSRINLSSASLVIADNLQHCLRYIVHSSLALSRYLTCDIYDNFLQRHARCRLITTLRSRAIRCADASCALKFAGGASPRSLFPFLSSALNRRSMMIVVFVAVLRAIIDNHRSSDNPDFRRRRLLNAAVQ